jgi:hypothetical protein
VLDLPDNPWRRVSTYLHPHTIRGECTKINRPSCHEDFVASPSQRRHHFEIGAYLPRPLAGCCLTSPFLLSQRRRSPQGVLGAAAGGVCPPERALPALPALVRRRDQSAGEAGGCCPEACLGTGRAVMLMGGVAVVLPGDRAQRDVPLDCGAGGKALREVRPLEGPSQAMGKRPACGRGRVPGA